jgi:hypothetical protein
MGEPTRHVCRYGCANSVSRTSPARFLFFVQGVPPAFVEESQ